MCGLSHQKILLKEKRTLTSEQSVSNLRRDVTFKSAVVLFSNLFASGLTLIYGQPSTGVCSTLTDQTWS